MFEIIGNSVYYFDLKLCTLKMVCEVYAMCVYENVHSKCQRGITETVIACMLLQKIKVTILDIIVYMVTLIRLKQPVEPPNCTLIIIIVFQCAIG